MKLRIDKHRVSEGETVTVKWDAGRAGSVTDAVLTVDNGFRKAAIQVERSGEKTFRLNRSNGATVISVSAVADGKPVRAGQNVIVKPARKYDSYTTIGSHPLKDFFSSRIAPAWGRIRYGWKSLPPYRRHSWIMLGILTIFFVLSLFHAEAAFYGLGILAIYLIWTLI